MYSSLAGAIKLFKQTRSQKRLSVVQKSQLSDLAAGPHMRICENYLTTRGHAGLFLSQTSSDRTRRLKDARKRDGNGSNTPSISFLTTVLLQSLFRRRTREQN